MNRSDLQKLALTRLKEAKILFENGEYSGAYYLCGYVIECGLKACIAKKTQQFDFPDKNRVNRSYSHDLEILLGIAGLKSKKDEESEDKPEFGQNWAVVKDWSESSRYTEQGENEARALLDAVADEKNGVLKWLQQHW